MKLAVSHIAWPEELEDRAAAVLIEEGIRGVEVAPARIRPHPLEASTEEVLAYRRSWERRGIRIVSLQALLYGRPELVLFESPGRRRALGEHLRGMARLGGLLGADVLVFGAPRNRRRNGLPEHEARQIAVPFFRDVAAAAVENGVVLCIEPNPPAYGCDFITEAREGLELVGRVGHPGFGLHLDAAGLTLAGEPELEALEACGGAALHFHASEPHLKPLGEGGVSHAALAACLKGLGYPHWVSLEMRHDPGRETLPEIRRALRLLGSHYGDGGGRPASARGPESATQ